MFTKTMYGLLNHIKAYAFYSGPSVQTMGEANSCFVVYINMFSAQLEALPKYVRHVYKKLSVIHTLHR